MESPPINPPVTPLPPSPKKWRRWVIGVVVLSFVILGIRWKLRSNIIDVPQGHKTIADNDTPKGHNTAEAEQRMKDYTQWKAERRKTGTSVTLSLLQNGTYTSAADGQPITLKDGAITYLCTVPGNPNKQTCADRLGATLITDLDNDGLDDGVAAIRESTDHTNWTPLTFVMLGTMTGTPKGIRQSNIPGLPPSLFLDSHSADEAHSIVNKGYIVDSITNSPPGISFAISFWDKTDSQDAPSLHVTFPYYWDGQGLATLSPAGHEGPDI